MKNREELIEEIKEYAGDNLHESIMDYINESGEQELKFFLWQLQNDWSWYDSDERFIHTSTRKVVSRAELLKKYEGSKNQLHPLFQTIINNSLLS